MESTGVEREDAEGQVEAGGHVDQDDVAPAAEADGTAVAVALEAPTQDLLGRCAREACRGRGPVARFTGSRRACIRRCRLLRRLRKVLADHAQRAGEDGLGLVVAPHDEEGRHLDAVAPGQLVARRIGLALDRPHHLVDLLPQAAAPEHLFRLRALLARVAARELLLDHRDVHGAVLPRLGSERASVAQGPSGRQTGQGAGGSPCGPLTGARPRGGPR